MGHQFPHLVLMQPDWVRVSSDEFIDRHAVNLLRSPDAFLSTVYENDHERGIAFFLQAFFFLREFSLAQDRSREVKWIER